MLGVDAGVLELPGPLGGHGEDVPGPHGEAGEPSARRGPLLGGLLGHAHRVADLAPGRAVGPRRLHVVVDELVAQVTEGARLRARLADLGEGVGVRQVLVDLLDELVEVNVEWWHASSVD